MMRLCDAADWDDGMTREYPYQGRSCIVVKWAGQFSVFENYCPHLGIELNVTPDDFMDADRRYLICANHGALFEPDSGRCVYGPCQGKSLRPIDFTLSEGAIFVATPSSPANGDQNAKP